MTNTPRRRVLAAAALGIGAGCTTLTEREAKTRTPTDTHTTAQTQTRADCQETTPMSVPVTVVDSETFDLSVAVSSVSYGGQVTVTLENTGSEAASTGNRGKFDIQTAVDDSWASVVERPDGGYWTDEAITHAPGEGFEWRLTLGPGIALDEETRPSYVACEPLDPGVYRFVYWGLIGETGSDRERAVATQFRLGERE